MILMRQHMDGIAECDAHHRRAGSYGNSRNTSLDKENQEQGKQSAEQYRGNNQRYRPFPFEDE